MTINHITYMRKKREREREAIGQRKLRNSPRRSFPSILVSKFLRKGSILGPLPPPPPPPPPSPFPCAMFSTRQRGLPTNIPLRDLSPSLGSTDSTEWKLLSATRTRQRIFYGKTCNSKFYESFGKKDLNPINFFS